MKEQGVPSTTGSLLSYCVCSQVILSVGIISVLLFIFVLKCRFYVPSICHVILMRQYKFCVTCNLSVFHRRRICDC